MKPSDMLKNFSIEDIQSHLPPDFDKSLLKDEKFKEKILLEMQRYNPPDITIEKQKRPKKDRTSTTPRSRGKKHDIYEKYYLDETKLKKQTQQKKTDIIPKDEWDELLERKNKYNNFMRKVHGIVVEKKEEAIDDVRSEQFTVKEDEQADRSSNQNIGNAGVTISYVKSEADRTEQKVEEKLEASSKSFNQLSNIPIQEHHHEFSHRDHSNDKMDEELPSNFDALGNRNKSNLNYDSPDRMIRDSMSGIGLGSDKNNDSSNRASDGVGGNLMNIEN